MFCIFFSDKYIKENSKFQSMTTLGRDQELIKWLKEKRQQTDSGTHRIYTSNKAPGLGRASSPISVMMGLKKTPISPRLRETVRD